MTGFLIMAQAPKSVSQAERGPLCLGPLATMSFETARDDASTDPFHLLDAILWGPRTTAFVLGCNAICVFTLKIKVILYAS